MKHKTFKIMRLLILTALTSNGVAQSTFSIDRFTIAGGGDTSSGGLFSLSGTLGQPASGAMSGGSFSLAGGFWGAIPTPPPAGNVITKVRVAGGEIRLTFTGIPGRIYYVDRARSVTGPWPERLAAITMPIGGVVEFVDVSAFSYRQSFYRTSTD